MNFLLFPTIQCHPFELLYYINLFLGCFSSLWAPANCKGNNRSGLGFNKVICILTVSSAIPCGTSVGTGRHGHRTGPDSQGDVYIVLNFQFLYL